VIQASAEEPKFVLMERQLYEEIDDSTQNDFGTFYLGGGFKNLHHSTSSDTLKPYKNHLDIAQVNFGKNLMIFLLATGQVYGTGMCKYRHFYDQEANKFYEKEQLIPFHDTKDKIESIQTYKRVTLAVTRKGKAYFIGEKLKKLLRVKNERFGFYPLPMEDPKEEGEGEEEAKAEDGQEGGGESKDEAREDKKEKEYEKLKAQRVWISRCKGRGNFVIYCLFMNTETEELEIHSLGKNAGGGLLGLGDSTVEALSWKRIHFYQ